MNEYVMPSRTNVHDLSVQSEKKWPILHSIEIEAVQPICERESSHKSTFICEQSALYEVGRLAVLWEILIMNSTIKEKPDLHDDCRVPLAGVEYRRAKGHVAG
jgi:hypothetical protein